MPRVYLKPIAFSDNNYLGPSGNAVAGGVPTKLGFAPEEWNNHPALRYQDGPEEIRAFHAEPLGNVECHDRKNPICLIMYSTRDGRQTLAGIAGSATYIKTSRQISALAKKLKIQDFSADLWKQDRVKRAFQDDEEKFLISWSRECKLLPCCICPTNYYFQPQKPVTLNAPTLTGNRQLLRMFSSYTAGNPGLAIKILKTVPEEQRDEAWYNISNSFSGFDNSEELMDLDPDDVDVSKQRDIKQLLADKTIGATVRDALIRARIGQGKFRAEVGARWDNRCAVSGCDLWQILRASHISPWSNSNNEERLDPRNGILLSANLDALFDRGFISFEDNGNMLVSASVPKNTRKLLLIPQQLRRKPDQREIKYLSRHRISVFKPN